MFASLPLNDTQSPPPNLRFPEWEGEYRAAILEIDQNKIIERVTAAENAIFARIQALAGNAGNEGEWRAIFEAQGTLHCLRFQAEQK